MGCWEDAAPVSRHSVRLALADHLDITFQEAHQVRFRKDQGFPTTHAHLTVVLNTRRLGAELGEMLLASFLTNASRASSILGLTVHDVEHDDDFHDTADTKDTVNASLTDSAAHGEESDQYAEYYAPLEQNAELMAKAKSQGGDHSVAGIALPFGIPTAAIIGVAIGIVVVLGSLVGCLYYKRRQLAAQKQDANDIGKTVHEDIGTL